MLYMVINTHSAESCAFRGEDEAEHLETAFDRFEKVAAEHGVARRGSWVNRPAHEVFVLVDAPDPHVIDEVLVGTGLVGRTTTRVLSVVALDDAVTPYTDAVLGDRAGNA
jgi:hypothetical protein